MFVDVFDVLRFSNFIVDTNRNPIANTTTGVITTNFLGNTIDFGDFDLTLRGPVSAVVETGGRRIPTLDIFLSTARTSANRNQVTTVNTPVPLNYTLHFDSGTNETTIDGNVLLDARASLNAFGSYDLKLQLSNRQTTVIDGRFDVNSPIDNDFDIGPIDIRGNVFADILATVADPFFNAAGAENIFELFGGRTARERQSERVVDQLETKAAGGGQLTEDDLAAVATLSLVADVLGDDFPETDFLADAVSDLTSSSAIAAAPGPAVPEPGTLLLLAAALALTLTRPRRTT